LNKYLSKKARSITPYTAGEQPEIKNIIKLNTNENPYPPSPEVLKSIQGEAGKLRLYPKTDGGVFRKAAAEYENVEVKNIFCANGSDELLAFAFLAFFDPDKAIKMLQVTYSFYPVWAELYNIPYALAPLNKDFSIDPASLYNSKGGVIFPNPNAPTGIAVSVSDIEDIVKNNTGYIVIVDEAYSAFGAKTAVILTEKYENLLIVKTLSKSHALAGLRCAYAVGSPDLIEGLERIKDSFNSYPLDMLAQAGAAAALTDKAYYAQTSEKIINTRENTKTALKALGFDVTDSVSNFLFITHPKIAAKILMQSLREKGIVVRHFDKPMIGNHLRVTVGTDEQMDLFLKETAAILAGR